MGGFYWKKRNSYYKPDYYVGPDGKVFGEVYDNRTDVTWRANVWSQSDRHFILLGVFISEECAKAAVEKYSVFISSYSSSGE